FIGTDVSGTAPLIQTSPNVFGDGLVIESVNNLIGGTTAGAGNVISGNTGNGLWLVPIGAEISSVGNLVHANMIAPDVTETVNFPNSNLAGGVYINGSDN